MKNNILIFTFLLSTLFSYSQQENTTIQNEKPYIEVTGTAEKEVIPDEIYIGIIIRESYLNKTKVTIEEKEEKLKAALTSIGINLSNLYLSNANADNVRIILRKKDVLTQTEYTLMVSTATMVENVFKELEKLEIKDAFISKVNHSQLEKFKKEVKIQAIKAAKEKADYLLNAIGEQTGKPLVVKENYEYQNTFQEVNVRASKYDAINYYIDGVKVQNEIEFQKIKVNSSIYIKFSIK